MKCLDGTACFMYISKLAKCLLALPHSSADIERVFSIVCKIVTDFRTELDQSTFCALLSCKLNSDVLQVGSTQGAADKSKTHHDGI